MLIIYLFVIYKRMEIFTFTEKYRHVLFVFSFTPFGNWFSSMSFWILLYGYKQKVLISSHHLLWIDQCCPYILIILFAPDFTKTLSCFNATIHTRLFQLKIMQLIFFSGGIEHSKHSFWSHCFQPYSWIFK